MRLSLGLMILLTLYGCSSVQNKVFNLNTNRDFIVDAPDNLDFPLLCQRLALIAEMNFLDNTPPPQTDKAKQDSSCRFNSTESQSGYSFAFAYTSSDEQGYSSANKAYPSHTTYAKQSIDLIAKQHINKVSITLKASNQEAPFNKLSQLIEKMLLQEYKPYYELDGGTVRTTSRDRESNY